MKKIGIDKRDPSYRHFYYDDFKILTSDPPKYEVHYVDDENDIDYIDCMYVIKIKDVFEEEKNVEENKVVEAKILDKESGVSTVLKVDKSKVNVTKPSKRGRKKKDVIVEDESNTLTIENQNEEMSDIVNPHIYSYDVIELSFSNITELKDKLNEFGKLGWELCSTEIYTEGLFNKKILCIMKKIEI